MTASLAIATIDRRGVNEIYNALMGMIRDGAVEPGNRLPNERLLAAQLATSRTVLRDALLMLQRDGLVTRKVGSGTYLAERAPQIIEMQDARVEAHRGETPSLQEIVEARLLFEPAVVALAAAHASTQNYASLERQLQKLFDAPNWLDFKEAIYAFTRELYRASGNRFLLTIYEQMVLARRQVNFDGRETHSQVARLVRLHMHAELQSIAEAVKKGDQEQAEQRTRAHLLGMAASANL